MLCTSVPLKSTLRTAAHWNTSEHVFFPLYFDALLLWGKMVRCRKFPWHHALRQGSISAAGELLWLITLSHSCCVHTWSSFSSHDYCVSKRMHCSWRSPPKRTLRDDWDISWNELAMLLNGSKVLFSELKCWFGIWNIGLIPLKRHKIQLFSPGRMSEMCPSGLCILYLKWDVSQYGLCSLV